ncbi:hypothetical protein O6H91_07G057800 [Diphasiastrum complanatum]|uniref:Uncharacterized protein n=1 Tax=Diphasiastrum complanatum TaxID=34168 RepID=A0ACC2D5H1_DIPCM|nr:hypothetical protein O6H91_07G057800 [Diphasiastrum complanatum]
MAKKIAFSRWREHKRGCSRIIIIIWTIIVGYWLLRGFSQSANLRAETFDVEADDLSKTFPSASWKIEYRNFLNKDQRLLSTPNTIVDAQENGSSIVSFIGQRATAERLSRLYNGRSLNLPFQSARDEEGSIMNLAKGNLLSNAQRIDQDVAASASINYNQSSKLLALEPIEMLPSTGEDFEIEKDDVVELDAQSNLNEDDLEAGPLLYVGISKSSNMSEGSFQVGDLTKKERVSPRNSHSGKQLQTTITQDQGEGDKLGKLVLGSNVRSFSRRCRTVEEMGAAAASDSTVASFRVRELIQAYLAEHGAEHVKSLPREQFCKRKFVLGRAQRDGFGNEMYKILTAAGLGIMLNRSLIVGEHSSTNPSYLGLSGKMEVPFGNYIMYSNQTFSMREVKHLWVMHGCTDVYKRPLTMRLDSIVRPSSTSALCEDWTKWQYPIIWFKGAEDAVALQLLLKNVHPAMRIAASELLGNPSEPRSRPNVFGELMRAFIEPLPLLNEAVDWALQGGPSPDIALHLRMLHSRSHEAADAASKCIKQIIAILPDIGRKCRVVLVSDTPSTISDVKERLANTAEVSGYSF